MAVALDNKLSTQGAGVTTLTTTSWTIAGSDRALVAGVGCSASSPPTVTAVKWGGSGGVSLTSKSAFVAQTFFRNELWGMAAPAAASQTLFASFSGTADEACLGGVSFTGADQGTTFGTPATANAASGNSSANVTLVSGDLGVDMVYTGMTTIAVGAGQASQWEEENINAGTSGGMSTEGGSGSVNYAWTVGGVWTENAIPILQLAAAAAQVPYQPNYQRAPVMAQ